MVSGFVTSPNEFSRISSGEASPIVIFVKLLFIFDYFLKAILIIFYVVLSRVTQLVEFYAQSETLQFMQQHVERLWDARSRHRLAFDDSLIGLASSYHVVRLDG